MLWRASPRILSEDLAPLAEPLAVLLRPGLDATPDAAAASAARALLDLPAVDEVAWPGWLAPHQTPAARRLRAIVSRYGGAVLADAVGLGKSYVALAVALSYRAPLTLVIPAVLEPQWRELLARFGAGAEVVTHETLSREALHRAPVRPSAGPPHFLVVDEAHRFRHPDTKRYRALAGLAVGRRVLLVTATPVHNRLADLFHLFRIFVRDDALGALGVPSLRRAARGDVGRQALATVAARLVVARSRARVDEGYRAGPFPLVFPARVPGEAIRAGPLPEPALSLVVERVARLGVGREAAALFRLTLLRRLASSRPAFLTSLTRYEAFVQLALEAAREGRRLSPREFQRLFPRGESADLQLALFPLLLGPGESPVQPDDVEAARALRALAAGTNDPKAARLVALLAERGGKTIVFTDAIATARHLARRLARRLRVAAVLGDWGWFGPERAPRLDVLRAFAPIAQGAAPTTAALETDVLVATDVLSEGLNLQDAARVVHYDLPWSPARLAQRVGRVDRLGSRTERIETITFAPPEALERALGVERRLAAKVGAQRAAGAAQAETIGGADPRAGSFDWCDRLEALARGCEAAPRSAVAGVAAGEAAVVLILQIGDLTDAVLVDAAGARADPAAATGMLELAARATPASADRVAIARAIERAAPLIRARLAAVEDARWRAADRDRMARRLIPWVLVAARRAARRGDGAELAALDRLLARLSRGMTAGEELLLEDLLARRGPVAMGDLLRWHERLPPVVPADTRPEAELVAALALQGGAAPSAPSQGGNPAQPGGP